ncbi:MAG: ribosomal protein S18-alanine N-acetyltransferase [Burkholderiaceae bacterium]
MSALPKAPPAIEIHDLREAHFEPMQLDHLAQVMAVEQAVYEWPWSEGNITDSIQAGYLCLKLMGGPSELLGYMIAMQGVDEVHLLNITVAPPYLRQGWARVMLDALALWAREHNAQWLWLEARASNTRAIHVYERYGFRRVGARKRYYPAADSQREDAIVMSYKL